MTISQGQSNINMWNTLILSTLIVVGLVALYPYGIYSMVCYFICINLLWLFVWQYFAWKLIRLSLWEALSDVLPFLVISIGVMAFTWWATRPIENLLLLMLSKIALAATLYILIMYLSGAKIMREALHFVRHRTALPEE